MPQKKSQIAESMKEKIKPEMEESEETKLSSTESAEKPGWTKPKLVEIEKIVIDLAKQGNSPSKIGIILRDKYSVLKTKILGKKITKILKDNNIKYLTEKDLTEKKIEKLKLHIAKHKQDYTSSRSLTKQLWALYRLEK